MRPTLFHLLLLGVSLSGLVGSEESAAVSSEPGIQPRGEGGRWLYRSFVRLDSDPEPAGISVEEVVGSKELDGVVVWQVRLTVDERSFLERSFGAPLGDDAYSWFWEYQDGRGSHHWDAEEAGDRPGSLDAFALTLRHPVEAGTEYEADGQNYRVLDVSREVTVPAGTFTCVVYEFTYADEDPAESRERYFQAPGVGLVVWEMEYLEDGKWVLDARDVLVSYQTARE